MKIKQRMQKWLGVDLLMDFCLKSFENNYASLDSLSKAIKKIREEFVKTPKSWDNKFSELQRNVDERLSSMNTALDITQNRIQYLSDLEESLSILERYDIQELIRSFHASNAIMNSLKGEINGLRSVIHSINLRSK